MIDGIKYLTIIIKQNRSSKRIFKLFGSGKDLDIEEPKDIDIILDDEVEPL